MDAKMEKKLVRQKRSKVLIPFTITLLAGLWRVYDRRTRERIPGHESIENPEVSAGFEWVSNMPQMRWIRHYVMSRAAALQDRGKAVDLGCGPGHLVLEMARHKPGLRVTGIDLSEKMLFDARQAAQQAGLEDRVDFRLGNAEGIPFPNQSLDLVISTLSLHHWSNPVKVLDEIDRVLKPGGAFYIFDLRRDMTLPFYLLIWFGTQFVVPASLLQVNEPMSSRNASYAVQELADLARQSRLCGGKVTAGPIWLVLEGKKNVE
jgi:ubiquinone/menaquinone biosynthesis C-methylase UbiE